MHNKQLVLLVLLQSKVIYYKVVWYKTIYAIEKECQTYAYPIKSDYVKSMGSVYTY